MDPNNEQAHGWALSAQSPDQGKATQDGAYDEFLMMFQHLEPALEDDDFALGLRRESDSEASESGESAGSKQSPTKTARTGTAIQIIVETQGEGSDDSLEHHSGSSSCGSCIKNMVKQLPGSSRRSEGSGKSDLEEKRERSDSAEESGAKGQQHIVPLSVSPIPDDSQVLETDFDAKKTTDKDKQASGPRTAGDDDVQVRSSGGESASDKGQGALDDRDLCKYATETPDADQDTVKAEDQGQPFAQLNKDLMALADQQEKSATVKGKLYKGWPHSEELKANTSPAGRRMQRTYSESTNPKTALIKGPSDVLGSPITTSDEKNAGEDQNSAQTAQEHAVFYQKQTALKDGIVLSQNEVQLLANLRERLVGIMKMSPNEFKSMMFSQYGGKAGKATCLLGRRTRKPQTISHCDLSASSRGEAASGQVSPSLESNTWLTLQSPEPSLFATQLISPRPKGKKANLTEMKMKMNKKLNRLIDDSNQKEDTLRALKEELEMLQNIDNGDKATISRVKREVAEQRSDYGSPERLYQGNIGEQLMDVKALKKAYDYTSVASIAEKREVLLNKIELVEHRLLECEVANEQYQEMISRLWLKNRVDDKRLHHEMVNKQNNMDNALRSLKELNRVESDRALQINNMQYQYSKTISNDQRKMERLQQERQVILANHETDTQQVLYKLLGDLREIKVLNVQLESAHKKRSKYENKYKELGKAFNKRQDEIDVLAGLATLIEMKNYSNELELATSGAGITDDQIRLKGLELILNLKANIKNTKFQPHFGQRTRTEDVSNLRGSQSSNSSRFSQRDASFRSKSPPKKVTRKPTEQQSALEKIENYIQNKAAYDQFYQSYYQRVRDFGSQFIIETYNMSTIKLNSLQQAHKDREQEKQLKVKEIQQGNAQLRFYQEEQQLIGQYLKSVDHNSQMKGEMKSDTSQLSLEGMKILLEQINLSRMSLIKRNKREKDAKNAFQSSMRNHLMNLIAKIRTIKIHVTALRNSGFEEHLAMQGVNEVLDRYEKEKQRKQKRGQKMVQQYRSRKRYGSRRMAGARAQATANQGAISSSSIKEATRSKSNSSSDSIKEQAVGRNRFYQDPLLESSPGGTRKRSHGSSSGDDTVDSQNMDAAQRTTSLESPSLAQMALSVGPNASRPIRNTDDLVLRDILVVLRALKTSNDSDNTSAQYMKRASMRVKKNFTSNDRQPDAHLLGGPKSGVSIDDFDPVFRKKDFAQVKKNVLNVIDLKKIYNPAAYKRMRADAKRKLEELVLVDQDQIDFRNDDPRKKKIDDEQMQKEFLEEKLQQLRNYEVKESLWRKEITVDERERHELNRKKLALLEVKREEKDFIENLREQIGDRYNRLKRNFEKEYILSNKARSKVDPPKTDLCLDSSHLDLAPNSGVASPLGASLQSRTLQKASSIQDSVKVYLGKKVLEQMHQMDARCQLEKDRANLEQFQAFEPIKSPCFDMKKRTAPKSSYLKERIRLNKMLTTSGRGQVIGVGSGRKAKDEEAEAVEQSVFSGQKLNTARVKTGYGTVKSKYDQMRASAAFVGVSQSPAASYTQNQLFNMTYRTMDTAKVLSDKSNNRAVAGAKDTARQVEDRRSQVDSDQMRGSAVDAFNKFFTKRGHGASKGQNLHAYNRASQNSLQPVSARQYTGLQGSYKSKADFHKDITTAASQNQQSMKTLGVSRSMAATGLVSNPAGMPTSEIDLQAVSSPSIGIVPYRGKGLNQSKRLQTAHEGAGRGPSNRRGAGNAVHASQNM